jgi:hypothetical protein
MARKILSMIGAIIGGSLGIAILGTATQAHAGVNMN